MLTEATLDAAFVEELPPRLIADKAWDGQALQTRLAKERGIELIAPKRGGKRPSRRKQDGRALRRYKRRWKIERLFAWLKRWRRLAARCAGEWRSQHAEARTRQGGRQFPPRQLRALLQQQQQT